MQNFKKLLNALDFEELYGFYENIAPTEVPQRVENICIYLDTAYNREKKYGFKDSVKLDITGHITLLKNLQDCSILMLDFSGRTLVLHSKEEGIKINIHPLFDFLQETDGNLDDVIDAIKEIQATMVNYLNAATHWNVSRDFPF